MHISRDAANVRTAQSHNTRLCLSHTLRLTSTGYLVFRPVTFKHDLALENMTRPHADRSHLAQEHRNRPHLDMV